MHILNTISVKLPVRFWSEGQLDGGGGIGEVEIKRVTKPCASVTPCCAATVSKLNAKQNLVGSLVVFLVRQGRQLLLLEMRQWHLTLLWEETTLSERRKHKMLRHFDNAREVVTSDWHCVFIGEMQQRGGKH